jgi:hypothetical protein
MKSNHVGTKHRRTNIACLRSDDGLQHRSLLRADPATASGGDRGLHHGHQVLQRGRSGDRQLSNSPFVTQEWVLRSYTGDRCYDF